MRLSDSAHTGRPWRIHELTGDFTLEDVWALPTPGGPDDFRFLVDRFATAGSALSLRGLPGLLWAIREQLGRLGLDRPDTGIDARVPSLRHRLPADLRNGDPGPELTTLPFRSIYRTDDEWAAEMANLTVHGVLHLGWVADDDGPGYHGQMAVLVKPNGRLGRVYMAAIAPLRHWLVYPQLMANIGRSWTAAQRA
jgi:hypothetical protein